jgi:hypothetical protein
VFKRSEGNVVRVQEILQSEYGRTVPYSTLTRIVRDLDLREDKKKRRSGTYEFGPVRRHADTSPHQVLMDKKIKPSVPVLSHFKEALYPVFPFASPASVPGLSR